MYRIKTPGHFIKCLSAVMSLAFLFAATSCDFKKEPVPIDSTTLPDSVMTQVTSVESGPPDVTGRYVMRIETHTEHEPEAVRMELLNRNGKVSVLFEELYEDSSRFFAGPYVLDTKANGGTFTAGYNGETEQISLSSDGETSDVSFLSYGQDFLYSGHYERQELEEVQHPDAIPQAVNDPDSPGGAVDAILAKEARNQLGMPEDAVLTEADLAKVEELHIFMEETVSLSGIEYFTGLRYISIDTCYITDISPLANIRSLERIIFCDAPIYVIPVFSQCENLTWLELRRSYISDITPVTNIRSLECLILETSLITSVAPIANMNTIKTLGLYGNPITDWEAISYNENLTSALMQDYDATLKLLDKARAIVKDTITDDMSDLEKEIAIYKRLHEIAESRAEQRPDMPSGYYVIMEGYGVCGDWSQAVELLMTLAGIECIQVITDYHAWNIVRIDGVYYEIDCMWDDELEPLKWSHFNVSRAYMDTIIDHHINLSRYPVATHSMMKLEYLMLLEG